MSPTLASSVFAFLVVATNWHYMRSVATGSVTTTVDLSGAMLAVAFSLGAIFFLGKDLYRLIRSLLARGVVVPAGLRFIDWSPCWILLLLTLHISSGFTGTGTRGETIFTQWGYGSDCSLSALLLSGTAIILFQFYARLSRFAHATGNA